MPVDNIEKAGSLVGSLGLTKISQGAEAIIFLTDGHPYSNEPSKISNKTIVKYRPKKPYRYPLLDKQIIKQRTVSESRVLFKLFQLSSSEINNQKNKKKPANNSKISDDLIKDNQTIFGGGVNCPKLISLDVINGFIFMEYINSTLVNGESSSLKNHLWLLEKTFADSLSEKLTVQNCDELVATVQDKENGVVCLNSKVKHLLTVVGIELGNMHLFDVIHGDLTSSNIVLNESGVADVEESSLQPVYEPYLIDFGLAYQSSLIEDKAVDLYVLEKALESTHPLFAKQYSQWILEGYQKAYELKGQRETAGKVYRGKHNEIIKRLEAVRLRGRKRSMIG